MAIGQLTTSLQNVNVKANNQKFIRNPAHLSFLLGTRLPVVLRGVFHMLLLLRGMQ